MPPVFFQRYVMRESAPPPPADPTMPTPMSYWRFESAPSNSFRPSMGTDNLTFGTTGTAAGVATGKVGNCADFVTKDFSYVSAIVNNASKSIAFWVNGSDPSATKVILKLANGSASNTFCSIGCTATEFGAWDLTGSNFIAAGSAASILNGAWHHIVYVEDSVGNTRKIYLNGALVTTGSGDLWSSTTYPYIEIGTSMDAYMDELAVYRVALTAEQVAYLYNNPGSIVGLGNGSSTPADTTGLVAPTYGWNFDGDTLDAMPTAVNSDALSGLSGSPAYCDGRSGRGNTVNASSRVNYTAISNAVNDNVSVSFWWRHDAVSTSTAIRLLVSWQAITTNRARSIGIAANGNVGVYNSAGTFISAGSAWTKGLFDGKWHHIVLVESPTGAYRRLYVDGVLNTLTNGNYWTAASGSKNFAVGGDFNQGFKAFGDFDEVRVYIGTALTQAQVTALYNAGA
jgi:hypothetical protein